MLFAGQHVSGLQLPIQQVCKRRYKQVVQCASRDPDRAQQLKAKAKVLRQQQDALAKQLQDLSAEAESLSETEKQEVQSELSTGQVASCPCRIVKTLQCPVA